MKLHDLTTPTVVIDADLLQKNSADLLATAGKLAESGKTIGGE